MQIKSFSGVPFTAVRSLVILLLAVLLSGINSVYAQTVEFDPTTATVTEGNTVTLNISTTSGSGVCDIDVFTSGDTATEGTDYTGIYQTITVNGSASVSINTTTDSTIEGPEDFFVELFDPGISGGANPPCILGTDFIATVTIEDPAPSPHTVEFSLSFYSDSEGNSVVVDVVPSITGNQACDIEISTIIGSAIAPGDYTAQNTFLSFAAVPLSQSLSIPLASDSEFEGLEDFGVFLTPGGSGSLPSCNLGAISDTTVEIVDQTPAPVLNFDPANITTVIEGGSLSLDLITTGSSGTCHYDLVTSDVTATQPSDYAPLFLMGAQISGTGAIVLDTNTDTVMEGSETFTVQIFPDSLSLDKSCTIGANNILTITIDELVPHTVEFTASIASDVEGNSVVLDVTASSPGQQACDINIATSNGSAVSPADFTAQSTTLSFGPTPTNQSLSIPLATDSLTEGLENFTVTLSPTAGGTLPSCILGTTAVATVDIVDDPPPAPLEVEVVNSTLTAVEGFSVNFEAALTTGSGTGSCEVDYSTFDGTAIAPLDYQTRSETITVDNSGPTPRAIFTLTDGLNGEGNETFTIVLSQSAPGGNNPPCDVSPNNTTTVTITDVAAPVAEIDEITPGSASAVYEGNDAIFSIDITSGSGICDVLFFTVDDSATSPADYAGISTVLTLGAGPQTVNIPTVLDTINGTSTKLFYGEIGPSIGGTNPSCAIGPDFRQLGQISDRTVIYSAGFNATSTVTEGIPATIGLEFSFEGFPTPAACDVIVTTLDGTATAPSDYVAQSTLFTVSSQGITNVPLNTLVDSIVESPETFIMQLSKPVSGNTNPPCEVETNPGFNTITITILDDSAPLEVEIASPTVTAVEGGNATIEVALTAGSSLGVCDVDIATVDGTAIGGTDYDIQFQTISVAPSPNSQLVVPITSDADSTEGNETFTVVISQTVSGGTNPACIIAPNDTATVTISEVAPPTTLAEFTVPTTGLMELEGNTAVLEVVATSGTSACEFDYTVSNGTAQFSSPADYLNAFSGTNEVLTPGVPTTISFPLVSDNLIEPNETFFVELTTATGGSGSGLQACDVTGSATSATVTIVENSPTVEISTAMSTLTALEGSNAIVNVLRIDNSNVAVCRVNLITIDGSGDTLPGDYAAVTNNPLLVDSSAGAQFSIALNTDSVIEPNEIFTAQLVQNNDISSVPKCAIASNDSTLITIVDDSAPLTAQITAATTTVSATEGTNAIVEVALTAGSSLGTCDIDITTLDGSAIASSGDYAAQSSTLTIQPSPNEQLIIPVLTDALVEGSQTFTVVLSSSSGTQNPGCAVGTNNTATITIVDTTTPPTVEFAASSTAVTTDENGVSPTLTLNLTAGTAPASVDVTTVNGSAQAPGDFTAITQTIVFAAGTTTQTIPLSILADNSLEPAESFTVVISPTAGSSTLVGQNSVATITIADTTLPPTVEFAASSTAVTTDENGVSPTLTLNLTAGTAPASVDVTTVNGSAEAPGDFAAITQTIVFPAGSTTQTLPLSILADDSLEPAESFTVVISPTAGSSTLVGQNSVATITIADTTLPPTVEFAAGSTAITVDENGASPTLTLNLIAGTAPASVDVTTVNGSAAAPGDFTAITQTIVFLAGSTTQTIPTSILTDDLLEPAESFTVVISPTAGSPTVVGQNNVSTITITDTTTPPTVEFDPGSISVTANENGGSVSLDLLLVNGAAPASVLVTTADGSAIAGQDYTGVSQTIAFPAGSTTQTITIPLLADGLIENNESFSVNLTATEGTATQIGAQGQATVNITDTSLTPASVQMATSAVNVAENVGLIQIELLREGNAPISVTVSTVDGTATAPADYAALSATVSWAANESGSKFVTIPIVEDAIVDPGESFSVQLSQANGGEIGVAPLTLVNIDDDSMVGVLVFASTNVSTSEGSGSVIVQVERLGGTDGSVTVNFATENSSAIGGSDFIAASGMLTWQAGESGRKDIAITLIDDTDLEGQEDFFIQLSGAAPLGDVQQLGEPNRINVTITDDSLEAGQLQFVTASTDNVSESESMVTVLVERVNGSEGNVLVEYATRDGSATNGEDYQAQNGRLSWEPGELGTKPITITLLNDDILEDNERFFIDLVEAFPISSITQIGDPASHTISIVDDDLNENTESPFRVAATNSSTRTHVEGQIAEGLDFEITDMRTGGTLAPQLQVRWRVEPQGAVEFLQGESRNGFVFTTTDQNGRTSNSVRVVRSDGVVRVIAEAMLTGNPSTTTDAGLLSRNDIPDFSVPVGQGFYTIRIGIGEVSTLNRNQDSTGDGLDVACDTLRLLGGADGNPNAEGADVAATQDLIATCEELEQQIENSQDPGTDLDRIAPEELFAITDSLIATADLQVTNVYSRINSIRSGNVERLDVSGLRLSLLGETIPGSVINAAQNALYGLSGGGAAAEDIFPERLGIFATGSISVGEIDGGLDDGSGEQQNADIETSSLSIGADYRFTDSLVFGGSLNFAKNETRFTSAAGGSEVENFSFTFFGTWYKSDIGYADLVLDVGQSSFDIERQINLIADDDSPVLAMGKTNAQVTSLTIGAGRNFNFAGWELGPYGRLSLTSANVDAYSERASRLSEGFGSVLNVRAHSATSTTISLGGQVSKAINTSKAVFVPQARFEFEAETEGSKDGITASFQADPSNSLFTITGNERDTSYFNLGIGASAQFTKGRSAQLFYETRAQQDNVAQHWLKFGFRLQF